MLGIRPSNGQVGQADRSLESLSQRSKKGGWPWVQPGMRNKVGPNLTSQGSGQAAKAALGRKDGVGGGASELVINSYAKL